MLKNKPNIRVKEHQDIRLYMGAMPDYFCKDLIAKFADSDVRGQVIAGHVSAEGIDEYRNTDFLVAKDLHLADHANWRFVNEDLHREYIMPCLQHYLHNYFYVLPTSRMQPGACIMSLYEKEKGHFAPHQDAIGGLVPQRSLTVICYLNDVYDGGETYFFNQDFKIMPRRGTIAIFPSNFIYGHTGTPPISEDKYILVSFVTVDVGDEKIVRKVEKID